MVAWLIGLAAVVVIGGLLAALVAAGRAHGIEREQWAAAYETVKDDLKACEGKLAAAGDELARLAREANADVERAAKVEEYAAGLSVQLAAAEDARRQAERAKDDTARDAADSLALVTTRAEKAEAGRDAWKRNADDWVEAAKTQRLRAERAEAERDQLAGELRRLFDAIAPVVGLPYPAELESPPKRPTVTISPAAATFAEAVASRLVVPTVFEPEPRRPAPAPAAD